MNLMMLDALFLCLAPAASYGSKRDQSKLATASFTVFGSIGIGLLIFLAYREQAASGIDWPRLIGIWIMMIALLLSEVPDVFQMIPDYRENSKEA